MPRLTPCLLGALALAAPVPAADLALTTRTRTETAPGSGRYHAVTKPVAWDAAKTAVVVCDMWDRHWCPDSTKRVGEMAPRMNEVVAAARKKGSLIIHCPSDTMDFYKDHPGRKLAQAAPKVEPKVPLQRWCALDPKREGKLPIDDTDGGCETPAKNYKAWSRQHEAITIEDGDAVTDSAEAYHLMRQRGVTNLVVMGVHTNMCVLGRPFSIRQMVQQGMNVVLVRDLTDTMYNPAKAPFVSHFTGTDLVVEHIERHWCPSVTSADFVGGGEFRFKDDTRPHLAVVAAEDEYKTEETLPAFALKELGQTFRVSVVYADAKDRHRLPGIEVLDSADVALFSVRRKPLVKEQLDVVRRFAAAGKPVVAIRTSSHAFAPRKGDKLPPGVEAWETFDGDVLGCRYTGHYPNKLTTTVTPNADRKRHEVLTGVASGPFESTSWLYKSGPLANGAVVLAEGKAGDNPPEPAAWVYDRPGGGRVFYTCLGHPDDFRSEAFVRLLRNGVHWAAGLAVR